jgi:hypothetical protein
MAPVGKPTIAHSVDEIERFASDTMIDLLGFNDAIRAEWIEARKAELVEVNRQMEGHRKAAGLPELRGEQDHFDGISGDLYSQIEVATATTPAGHACRLLIAFEHTEHSAFIEDLPACLYVSMLRDLLRFCPADIAARARVFVEAGTDQSEIRDVGDCLAQICGLGAAKGAVS